MAIEKEHSVSLKEHLELKIDYVDKNVVHVRELINERDKAKDLQAKEYERRLEALNHEAARLQLMVTKDLFDEVIGSIREEVTAIRLWRSNEEGKAQQSKWIAIAALIISAIIGVLSLIQI